MSEGLVRLFVSVECVFSFFMVFCTTVIVVVLFQTHFRFNALSGSLDFTIDFCFGLVFCVAWVVGSLVAFCQVIGVGVVFVFMFVWIFGLCFLCYYF